MWVPSFIAFVLLFEVTSGSLLDTEFEELKSHSNFTDSLRRFLEKEDIGLSPRCMDHLMHYRNGLRAEKQWAVEMFDAGAKLPSGVVVGNLVDLGSFDECLDIEEHISHTDSIHGKYCIGTIPMDISAIPKRETETPHRIATPDGTSGIQLATCLPDSCNATEMKLLYAHINITMVFYEELCQTKADQPELDGGAIAGISFFAVVLCVMLASTTYDIVLHYLDKKPAHYLLIAFSVLTNGKKLIATSNSPAQISCLHGLRVISTMWIILDHRYSIQYGFPIKNYFYQSSWVHNKANMFMLNATLGVDTFFLLAGIVVTYSYLNSTLKGVKFNIIMHYVHRYLRLTPVLAALMLFHATIIRYLGSGPMWPSIIEPQLIDGCERFWWKTLLYIQNYGREATMCIPHGWYLSADFQLFLLSPAFLICLKKWPKFALSATAFLTVLNIVACFLIAWFFELHALMQADQDFEKQMQYVWYYYFPSHTRAAPWLIGIVLGYVIFKSKQRKVDKLVMNKAIMLVLWVASLAILCICVFVGHNLIAEEYDRLANSFHIALVRPSWTVAIAWIIFACVTGYGGPVNWFLSLPIFEVLSKLTYTLYLVHYPLIYIITAQMRTTILFSNFQAMYMFWGDFVFTFVVSLILTLAFEFPVVPIESFLFGRGKRKEVKQSVGVDNKSAA